MTSGSGMANSLVIVGLGELLWDLFPTGRQLGGAPANFAYHISRLGHHGLIASRVGDDELGHEAITRVSRLGLPTEHIQIDSGRPTGTVTVKVDAQGQPDFTITPDVAWDFLEWTPSWEALARQADAVCFGSLAQRSPIARTTIHRFLASTRPDCLKILDINLRQSYYSAEVLDASLRQAHLVKLNHEEVPRLLHTLHGTASTELPALQDLLESYRLELICVTRGAEGSLMLTPDQVYEQPGLTVEVADTVGAGDAFTAALVHFYLRRLPLATISAAANRLGAWVASQVGATPSGETNMWQMINDEFGAASR